MQPREARRGKVTIIGAGSPFGADRLGWLAVDWLKQSDLSKHLSNFQFAFIRADRPGALLLEYLCSADTAIIIDAMQAGLPPGTLRTFTPDQLSGKTGLFSSHGFGVAESIALGSALGRLPRSLSLIGIEMGDDMSGASLANLATEQLYLRVEDILTSLQ